MTIVTKEPVVLLPLSRQMKYHTKVHAPLMINPPIVMRTSFIGGSLCSVPNTTTSVFWSFNDSIINWSATTPYIMCTCVASSASTVQGYIASNTQRIHCFQYTNDLSIRQVRPEHIKCDTFDTDSVIGLGLLNRMSWPIVSNGVIKSSGTNTTIQPLSTPDSNVTVYVKSIYWVVLCWFSSMEDIVKFLFTVLGSWFAMLWESQLRLKEMLQDETNLEFIWNGGQLYNNRMLYLYFFQHFWDIVDIVYFPAKFVPWQQCTSPL